MKSFDSKLCVPTVRKCDVRTQAFTLMELLTVIAIIGVLASLLFPAVRSARQSANKAKTRVQFNQWAAAIEGFRSEYGYYPVFHSSNLVNPVGQNTDPSTLHLFHDVLAGRRRDGSALPAYSSTTDAQFPEVQNRRLASFHSFGASDFTTDNLLHDACDNTSIAVLVDRDLDGIIKVGSDFTTLPPVNGLTPTSADFPDAGVRAGVVFYSASPDASSANPEFIFSWK
jgi:prepilin-type N-terminal cleavage/methylation domain-containing protein